MWNARIFFVGMLASALCVAPAWATDAIPEYVTAAVLDPGRPPSDIAQDKFRKPEQVLAFSTIKPGMRVAEVIPFGGYYTRMLSKLVGSSGHVYAIAPMWSGFPDLEAMIAENKKLASQGKPPVHPNTIERVLAIQNISEYANVTAMLEMLWQYDGQFSVPEQLDAVFAGGGNYHDMHWGVFGVGDDKSLAVNKAMFASLKPGGIFLVIDHRAATGTGFSSAAKLARIEESAFKAEMAQVGFVLDGESDVLRSNSDDYSKVATDPSLRGRTDDFVLRYKKPDTASAATLRPPKGSMDGYYENTAIMNRGMNNGPPKEERRMIYHADGSYQEFGLPNENNRGRGDAVQSGLWYWDAAGHNCMLHQFPADERGFVVCHSPALNKKPGDQWMQGKTPFVMLEGVHPLPDPRAKETDEN